MPRVQVAVTQVSKKAAEAGKTADDEKPPGPRFSLPQWKLGQP